MTERLRNLWPSLYTDVQRQIVDPNQPDPDWMDELTPHEREKLREGCRTELAMMAREAKRRSNSSP